MSPNESTESQLMNLVRLATDVTAVESPDIPEHVILGDFCLVLFWPIQAVFVVREPLWGATLSCRNPLLSSKEFTRGHLMKIKCLVADIAAVKSPNRAKHAILG